MMFPHHAVRSLISNCGVSFCVCWHQIVEQASPGVLCGQDSFIIEQAANLLAEYRRGPDKMQVTRIHCLRDALIKLGYSPTSRRTIGAEKPKGKAFKRLK